MKSSPKIIHAISYSYIRRKLRALYIGLTCIFFISGLCLAWLVSHSAWWWLLAVPLLIAGGAATGLVLITVIIMRFAAPQLSSQQQRHIEAFVDKMERVADDIQTPIFLLVVRLVFDVARHTPKPHIRTIIDDSSSLHTDFVALHKHFAVK